MAVDLNVIEEFVGALQSTPENTNTVYSATVSRIDREGTVWVYVAGSNKETPTSSASSEVKRGDHVNVEFRNNKLYIAGNYSNPSAGVERVVVVEQKANTALEDSGIAHSAAVSATESAAIAGRAASVAQTAAEAAQATANSKKRVFTSQPVTPYSVGDLWVDTSGSIQNGDILGYGSDAYSALVGTGQVGYMVVGGVSPESESVVYVCTFARSANESFSENDWQLAATDDGAVDELREWFWHDANGAHILGDVSGYRNDITSTGMKIMDTSTETSVAEFGGSGAQIGRASSVHVQTDSSKVSFYDGSDKLSEMDSTGMSWFNGESTSQVSLKTGITSNTLAAQLKSGNADIVLANDSSNYRNTRIEEHIQLENGDYRYTGGAELRSFDFIIDTDKYKLDGTDEDDIRLEFGVDLTSGNALDISRAVDGGAAKKILSLDKSGSLTLGGHTSAIGTVLSSVWTASSSSASGTNCTAEITLTPGTWMLGMITPTCSTSIAYYFSNISGTLTYPYFNMGTGGSGWVPVVITSSTSTRIKTGSSTSVTYSDTARGRILAIRIV